MKRLRQVRIRYGFWQGCVGVITGKIPFLPVYCVYIVEDRRRKHTDCAEYSELVMGPQTQWFAVWNLIDVDTKSGGSFRMTDECIRYLYKHHHLALNQDDPEVKRVIRFGPAIGDGENPK